MQIPIITFNNEQLGLNSDEEHKLASYVLLLKLEVAYIVRNSIYTFLCPCSAECCCVVPVIIKRRDVQLLFVNKKKIKVYLLTDRSVDPI